MRVKVNSIIKSFDYDLFSLNFSVLVFPPVNNYRRFLIHKTCQQLQQENTLLNVSTFSIGQGQLRRTVVCMQEQIIKR